MAFTSSRGNGGFFNSYSANLQAHSSGSSPVIDLTSEDRNDENIALSDTDPVIIESSVAPKTSPRKKRSASVMDEDVDQVELQASIERDVLQPARPLPIWGSSKVTHTFKVSKQPQRLGLPSNYPTSDTLKSTLLQPRNEKHRRHPHTEVKENCKMTGHSTPSAIVLSDSDDDLGFAGAAIVNEVDNSTIPKEDLLPDSLQEIIDLEEDEAAEEAEEIEDEASDQLMVTAAIDETDANVLSFIEIFSDDEGDADPKPSQPQLPPCLERQQSSIRSISTRFENLRLDEQVDSIKHGDYMYKPGDGIEFLNGTFMRLKTIRRDLRGNVIVTGPLLVRQKQHSLDPTNWQGTRLFPEKGRRNELVWTVTVDGWPNQDEYVDRESSEILRPREIIFTNQSWPSVSSRLNPGGLKLKEIIENGPLFCRWKRTKLLQIKRIDQEYEECIVKLTKTEADFEYSFEANKLRYASRRQHPPPGGGTATKFRKFLGEDDKTSIEKISQYSFADCFCGCGGASRGAQHAKLAIQWALDYDQMAVKSYRANFKEATCYQEHVSDFLHRLQKDPDLAVAHMVDILHLVSLSLFK